jgi:hypothetical protein
MSGVRKSSSECSVLSPSFFPTAEWEGRWMRRSDAKVALFADDLGDATDANEEYN